GRASTAIAGCCTTRCQMPWHADIMFSASGQNSAPCRVAMPFRAALYPLALFSADGTRNWLCLVVVGAVGRRLGVGGDDHADLLPDEVKIAGFVPLVSALQRPQEVVNGLQTHS